MWVSTSDKADIRLPLGHDATQRLLDVMAAELVRSTVEAARELTVEAMQQLSPPAAQSMILAEQAS